MFLSHSFWLESVNGKVQGDLFLLLFKAWYFCNPLKDLFMSVLHLLRNNNKAVTLFATRSIEN